MCEFQQRSRSHIHVLKFFLKLITRTPPRMLINGALIAYGVPVRSLGVQISTKVLITAMIFKSKTSEKFRLDCKIVFQNTFYTKSINVIIDSIGPSIILRSILIICLTASSTNCSFIFLWRVFIFSTVIAY